MSVAGMMTPIRSSSYRNLQLNAGLLFCGYAISADTALELKEEIESILSIRDADEQANIIRTGASTLIAHYTSGCLGITRGGGSFVVNQETRQTEADGVRYRFKGDTVVDSVDAQLTGTLLELTPGNLKRVLAGTAKKTLLPAVNTKIVHQTYTSLRVRNPYLKHLTWVGDLLDGRYVMIHFNWAMNTSGMNLTFTDKGEATMPFEFHAFQAQVEDYNVAPFDISFFRDIYDVNVSGMTFKHGSNAVTLTPVFDPEEDEYEITVPSTTSHLVGTMKLTDKRATVNAEVYTSGGSKVNLSPSCITGTGIDLTTKNSQSGNRAGGVTPPFTIKLTPQDKQANVNGTTYTINVNLSGT